MAIVWDDRLKKNIMDIGAALNPRWGGALAAGVDLFENLFLEAAFILLLENKGEERPPYASF
jgi:hypothetical protein